MRLPNGYGSVTKLNGNRRKPWRVRVTEKWITNEDGTIKQVYKNIGCYASKKEALQALAEYHENPYDINSKITFAELYKKWSNENFQHIGKSSIDSYKTAFKTCTPIHSMKFIDLKTAHLQGVIDNCGKNYPSLRRVKVLYNQLYKYAMKNDLVTKDYSNYVDIAKYKNKTNKTFSHTIFTNKEIETLWNNIERNEYVSTILMLIYSGVRVSELLDLKKENINLQERWFDVVSSKTEAGIRKVPISKKTLPYFEYWYNKTSSEYLLTTIDGKHFDYKNYYRSYWQPLMKEMFMEHHRPHDTRHTCISMLTVLDTNPTIIKTIVGHAGAMSLTEKVYTHLEIEHLISAIDKI